MQLPESTTGRTLTTEPGSTTVIIRRETKPKVKRFNSKIFDRPPVDESKVGSFTLFSHERAYQKKREAAKKLRAKRFRLAFSNAILTIIAIATAFTDDEMCYYDKLSYLQSTALRLAVIVISGVQIVITVLYAKCQLERKKLLDFVHPKSEP